MLSLNTAPAVVVGAAEAQVAALDDRLWAAVPDDDLIDGVAALERLKARLAALQPSCWPRSRLGTCPGSSWPGDRPPTGTPTSRG